MINTIFIKKINNFFYLFQKKKCTKAISGSIRTLTHVWTIKHKKIISFFKKKGKKKKRNYN